MRAPGRSTLFTTTIGFSPSARALRVTKRVCGIGPSTASTSSSTLSTIESTRSTSPPKSAWPGVSTMLTCVPFHSTAQFFARIVMPRSRSRSFESITRSATFSFARRFVERLQGVERVRVAHVERSRSRAAQRGEVRAAAEGRADRLRQGPDVGALAAANVDGPGVAVSLDHVERVQDDGPRRALDLDARSRIRIERAALVLQRGMHGWALLAGPDEARAHAAHVIRGHRDRAMIDVLDYAVSARRSETELLIRGIFLVVITCVQVAM